MPLELGTFFHDNSWLLVVVLYLQVYFSGYLVFRQKRTHIYLINYGASQLIKHIWMARCNKAKEMRIRRREVGMSEKCSRWSSACMGDRGGLWWSDLQNLSIWGGPWTKRTMTGQH